MLCDSMVSVNIPLRLKIIFVSNTQLTCYLGVVLNFVLQALTLPYKQNNAHRYRLTMVLHSPYGEATFYHTARSLMWCYMHTIKKLALLPHLWMIETIEPRPVPQPAANTAQHWHGALLSGCGLVIDAAQH